MRIGDLAKAAGVHVQTIRFYERRRLLPPPARSSGGYREYSSDTVRLVQFIRQVQAYGYALEEIRELLALGRGPHVPRTVRDRAQKKLQQIEAEIGRLCRIRDALTQLLQEVDRGATPPGCLVLQGASSGVTQTSQVSSPGVASRTRTPIDPATRSERQSQRVGRVRADHHSPRVRRDRV
jgi:MerR family copper efflux transcriptional regulator